MAFLRDVLSSMGRAIAGIPIENLALLPGSGVYKLKMHECGPTPVGVQLQNLRRKTPDSKI